MSSDDLSLREAVTHPASLATVLTGFLGGLMHLPLVAGLWAALWGSLGSLFPAASIAAFTLASEVPWLPREPLVIIALVLGALYVLKLLSKAYKKFQANL